MENKIEVDFQVLNVEDPYVLMIADTSRWAYAEDKPAMLFITMPNTPEPLHFHFPKKKDLVFNSHNLGVSCLSLNCEEQEYLMLPDGVYKIKLQSKYQGIYKERLYLRTHLLKIKLFEEVVKMGDYNGLTKCQKDTLNSFNYALLRSEAYTSRGDQVRAAKYYKEADELIEKLRCESCNGK